MRGLFAPVGFILLSSLVELSSISRELFTQQVIWIGLSLIIVFIFGRIDWRSLFNYRWVVWGIYLTAVLLLVFVYVAGPVIRGAKSWVVAGPVTFQPVELAKIALIFAYARYFSRRHLTIARWQIILISFFMFLVPGLLTSLQPDLGSTLVLFSIWFGFLLISGLPLRRVLAAFLLFAILGILGWHFLLEEYHRARIVGLFYPEENALTVNYSVIQSKIAIGSAGLWGKGYGQGSQTQLGFLTEPATDFILASLIEEWGILIGLLVIVAFAIFVLRILRIGAAAAGNFEKFVCLGAAVVFGIHFLLNAGSTVGIFPVVGVTFPFLSYGGSSLLTSSFLLAIIYAIAKR